MNQLKLVFYQSFPTIAHEQLVKKLKSWTCHRPPCLPPSQVHEHWCADLILPQSHPQSRCSSTSSTAHYCRAQSQHSLGLSSAAGACHCNMLLGAFPSPLLFTSSSVRNDWYVPKLNMSHATDQNLDLPVVPELESSCGNWDWMRKVIFVENVYLQRERYHGVVGNACLFVYLFVLFVCLFVCLFICYYPKHI